MVENLFFLSECEDYVSQNIQIHDYSVIVTVSKKYVWFQSKYFNWKINSTPKLFYISSQQGIISLILARLLCVSSNERCIFLALQKQNHALLGRGHILKSTWWQSSQALENKQ